MKNNGQALGTRTIDRPGLSTRAHLSSFDIVIPAWDDVASYLSDYPALDELVPEVCAEVRRRFGSDAELSLEVYRDPETSDSDLGLYVRLERYGPDILDQIDKLNRSFDDRMETIPGYFLVTTDFRRPRSTDVV